MFILGKVLTIKVTKSTKKVKLGSRPVEKLDGSKKKMIQQPEQGLMRILSKWIERTGKTYIKTWGKKSDETKTQGKKILAQNIDLNEKE